MLVFCKHAKNIIVWMNMTTLIMTSFSRGNTNKQFANPHHVSYFIYQASDGFWDYKFDFEIYESKMTDIT